MSHPGKFGGKHKVKRGRKETDVIIQTPEFSVTALMPLAWVWAQRRRLGICCVRQKRWLARHSHLVL